MSKILLVDDDKQYLDVMVPYLADLGHIVDSCCSGEEALVLLREHTYDLVILDWTMPGISGHEVCTQYRETGGQTPIMFLTGRGEVADLETGLDAGADDYLSKPFDMRELNARIKTILRRKVGQIVPKLTMHDVTLVLDRQIAHLESNEKRFVKLRPKEAALLEFLFRNPNRTHSAQTLLEKCWSSDAEAGTNSVRTWMGNLRNKLEQLGKGDLIQTVVGSGYFVSDQID
ncbi:MAG TPA: response regulator transcription factor [Drouetiella sp.]